MWERDFRRLPRRLSKRCTRGERENGRAEDSLGHRVHRRYRHQKVIPGILKSPHSEVVALGSRDKTKAGRRSMASAWRAHAPMAHMRSCSPTRGSMRFTTPLPNHLHVPITLAAARAASMCCVKSRSPSPRRGRRAARCAKNVRIAEAFVMVRHHPQWHRAREIAKSGELGEVRLVRAVFLYHNVDPANVRNLADIGGGACSTSAATASSPAAICSGGAQTCRGVGRSRPGVQDRPAGERHRRFRRRQAAELCCGTQTAGRQSVEVLRHESRARNRDPLQRPPTRSPRSSSAKARAATASPRGHPAGRPVHRGGGEFRRRHSRNRPVEYGVEDAILQMKVIDAVFRSEKSGAWENVA